MQKDVELIHRYLMGALPPQEHMAFQQRLEGEEGLRQQVALHQLSLEALRQHKASALRTRFSNPENMAVREKALRSPLIRRLAIACMLLTLTIILIWLLLGNGEFLAPRDTNPSVPVYQYPGDTAVLLDTFPQEILPIVPHTDTASLRRRATLSRLYAANFDVYPNMLVNVRRGSKDTLSILPLFFQLYDNARYREALKAFPANVDDDWRFYQANVLLQVNSTQQAISILRDILVHGESQYLLQAHWYLALASLQTGHSKEALTHLQILQQQPAASYRKRDAARLIKELEKIRQEY